jgi:hypothetical protein
MPDKSNFDPSKVSIVEYKIIKGQINSPDQFVIENVKGHHLTNNLQLSFNLDDKLIKVDFTIDISSDSTGGNEDEANASFHLVYIFKIENLEELAKPIEDAMDLESNLANAVASITYSTSRGILLTRLQGTALQNFMLPIIDANQLLAVKWD